MKKLARVTVEVVLEGGAKMTLDFDTEKALRLLLQDARPLRDVVENWRRGLSAQTRGGDGGEDN